MSAKQDIKAIKFICITLGFFLSSSTASANQKNDPYKTLTINNKTLITRTGTKPECKKHSNSDECQVLDWNGEILLSEYFINIDALLPSKDIPRVLFVTTGTGGNICCTNFYLIDFSYENPSIIELESGLNANSTDPKFNFFPEGFTYENIGNNKASLGEPILKVYRYKYGSAKIETLRLLPKYTITHLEKKEFPYEILDDPTNREPLLNKMGEKEFMEFRSRTEAQDPIERVNNTIYIGKGCMRYACTSSKGIFIIDTESKKSWIIYADNANGNWIGKSFGSLTNEDIIPRQLIEKWLTQNNILWPQIISEEAKSSSFNETLMSSGRGEVPLLAEGGVFKIPAKINGIVPVSFIIDSGAADVVIPADVADILIRTGTLSAENQIGSKIYILADGSKIPLGTFKLRSIQVGNRILRDITATITGVDGGLLLGQSFLSHFKKWSIDNIKHTIEFE